MNPEHQELITIALETYALYSQPQADSDDEERIRKIILAASRDITNPLTAEIFNILWATNGEAEG